MRCLNCGIYFDEEVALWESDPYGHYRYCPHCGSDALDNSNRCKVCDCDIPDEEWICKDCHDEVIAYLSEAVGGVFESPDYAKLDSHEMSLLLEDFINNYF